MSHNPLYLYRKFTLIDKYYIIYMSQLHCYGFAN